MLQPHNSDYLLSSNNSTPPLPVINVETAASTSSSLSTCSSSPNLLKQIIINNSQQQQQQTVTSPSSSLSLNANQNLQASSVKKLKKLLGAGTPDILQAKNLTQRYAELLPIATLKGNAQVKLVSSHRASSMLSSTSAGSTFITWQPAFLAVVRRTLHIFLLSRPPGLFIPAEIALSLFAFSLENPTTSNSTTTTTATTTTTTNQQPMTALTSNSSSSSSSSLVLMQNNDATISNSTNNSNVTGVATASLQHHHHRSPYIILKPSIVTGGVHEALALDWDPMAWEYWILIDSDQDVSTWIDCLQQVQRTLSHPTAAESSSSPSSRQNVPPASAVATTTGGGGSNKTSGGGGGGRSTRYQKRHESVAIGKTSGGTVLSQDDLALSGGASNSTTVESTRRIINDLKRWKMRLGGKSFKNFLNQSSSTAQRSSTGGGDDNNSNNNSGSSSQPGNNNKPLGVYLASCEPSTTNPYVPAVVELCVAVIEARGLDTVGVYRVPGNNAAVTALWDSVVIHGIENVNADDPRWSDIHVVGSLLKSFFRKLSEPLFPYNVYRMLMSANRQTHSEKRMLSLKRVVHQLPPHHYETLRFLAKHLQVVAANCQRNKMDINNLAIVFGPTLVRGKLQVQQQTNQSSSSLTTTGAGSSNNNNNNNNDSSSINNSAVSGDISNNTSNPNNNSNNTSGSSPSNAMNDLVKDTADQCRIVQTIVKHVDWFFAGWEADSQVPADDSSPNDAQQGGVFTSLNATVGASAPAPPQQPSATSPTTSNPSPKEFVSNIFSAGRYFRRRSDNVAATSNVNNRQRVVSLPQTTAAATPPSVQQQQEATNRQARSLSLYSQQPSASSLGSVDATRTISEDDEQAAISPQKTTAPFVFPPPPQQQQPQPTQPVELPPPRESRQEWQRKNADGFYAAKLTYIAAPPSPPTSTHVHPTRRGPPPPPQQQQGPSLSTLMLEPSSLVMPRSLSLDSIEVFNNNNNEQQQAAIQMGAARSGSGGAEVDEDSLLLPLMPGDTTRRFSAVGLQPPPPGSLLPPPAVLYGGSDTDPNVRLAKLEYYLNRLAAAEDMSFKEARKLATQRLQMQAEYERLRADLTSGQQQQQQQQHQHQPSSSQARF